MTNTAAQEVTELHDPLLQDMEAVQQIPIVHNMLEIVCQLTGMGFAAVARVTEERWMACTVRDEVGFGLAEGGELDVKTTLCNEIRDHRKPIVFDNVAEDGRYCNHHTPKIYGLQSYISFPIILKDGTFFGTLCAISAQPASVKNTSVMGTFSLFADLLAFHLQSLELLERSKKTTRELAVKNQELQTANNDLDNFVYTASHDLKSPVGNIQNLLDVLSATIAEPKPDREEINQIIGLLRANLKRFSVTIKDLTTFIETDHFTHNHDPEEINLHEIAGNVKLDLDNLITETNARIEVVCGKDISFAFPKKNFKSLLYNLVSNAIKYRAPDREPEVLVKLEKLEGKIRLSVSDNGLGIPEDKQDKIFTMFKRFHSHVEGSGLGLYIVKRMVDNVNGKIKVDSEEGKGSRFTVIF